MSRLWIALSLTLACGGSQPLPQAEGEPVAEPEPRPEPQPAPERVAEPTPEPDPPPPPPPPPPPADVPDDLDAPLSADARAALDALPNEDIDAPGEFYYRSNEWRHDLLVPELDGRGGAYVGVGSDQCYTLAAMAGSKLIVAVDYDPRIRLVHAIYQVLVPASETPDALVARFTPEAREETEAMLREGLAAHPQVDRIVRMFRNIRSDMHPYLERVQSKSADRLPTGRHGSWLADPAYYAHVRSLFRGGRVVARTGDVTAQTTLRAVGQTLARLEVPVRVLYYSNAEQFFRYTDSFQENVRTLPTDERTLVVRTIRHPRLPNADGDRWHYVVQGIVDFRERIESGAYPRSQHMLEDLVRAGEPFVGEELSRLTTETPRVRLERMQRRR